MSEIEKLFKNTGITLCHLPFRSQYTKCSYETCNGKQEGIACAWYEIPILSSNKQLQLIKFLLQKGVYYDVEYDKYWFHLTDDIENSSYKEFDEALAECISKMWKQLMDTEKQKIREMLEGE